MKKKIAILGSTGSIGKTTFNIIKKNKEKFDVVMLSTNKNINEIFKQAKILKVKNVFICSKKHYLKAKNLKKIKGVTIHNNLKKLNQIIKNKIDYTMCAISGIEGLQPTIDAISFSKKIAIANKESLICAWDIIKKKIEKKKTIFIPVDSEHFSIWSLLKESKDSEIEEIVLTASGGPFLNLPLSKFKKIKSSSAIKHPNWKMGKKISVDSSTMMNKVFEIIEAQKIFNIEISKFRILTHPNSYIHAMIKFKNGLTKILAHDTDMTIPIFNSIFDYPSNSIKTKKLNLNVLNNLNFKEVNKKRFPVVKIVKNLNNKNSLYETVLVSSNDELVDLFLKNKIKYNDIVKNLFKIINLKKFKKLKLKKPKNVNQIHKLNHYVRLKTRLLSIK